MLSTLCIALFYEEVLITGFMCRPTTAMLPLYFSDFKEAASSLLTGTRNELFMPRIDTEPTLILTETYSSRPSEERPLIITYSF